MSRVLKETALLASGLMLAITILGFFSSRWISGVEAAQSDLSKRLIVVERENSGRDSDIRGIREQMQRMESKLDRVLGIK